MRSTERKDKMEQPEVVHISESPFSRALFGNVRWAWLWLLTRLAVGYLWIHAGWGKLHNPAWVGANAGTGLNGFIQGALQKTGGAYPQVQSWYAWFLSNVVQPNVRIMSYVVSIGEFLVGLALILGIFVGIAAFFGVVMNVNYLLAGSISMNPLMLLGAILLALAWRTAGWIGLDRWVLPALGTPWSPGYVFHIRHGSPRKDHEPLSA
jgi:thiosulfate dehydrogenase [quinone] large subunit